MQFSPIELAIQLKKLFFSGLGWVERNGHFHIWLKIIQENIFEKQLGIIHKCAKMSNTKIKESFSLLYFQKSQLNKTME